MSPEEFTVLLNLLTPLATAAITAYATTKANKRMIESIIDRIEKLEGRVTIIEGRLFEHEGRISKVEGSVRA